MSEVKESDQVQVMTGAGEYIVAGRIYRDVWCDQCGMNHPYFRGTVAERKELQRKNEQKPT